MLLSAVNICSGDTVIKKDGTEAKGKIIESDNEMIVLEMGTENALIRMKIPKKDVRAVIKDNWKPAQREKSSAKENKDEKATGPGYYPIPIVGEIGVDVEAKHLRVALADARKAKPDIVVLYIDSPGGSVEETGEIVALLGEYKDMRIVACVRQALSAAAIITMSCKEIFMLPGSTIGAAVPYEVSEDGKIQPIEAKLKSAIHAQFRTAAELGGHDPLLVEAMVDPEVQVVLTESEGAGKRVLAQAGDGKIIKAKGKILTLTPNEAAECGLSLGTVQTMETLNEVIGIDSWRRVNGKGWAMMTAKAAEARRNLEKEERKAALQACLEKIKPQLDAIDKQITTAQTCIKMTKKELALLKQTYDREVASINAEYNRDCQRNSTLRSVGRYQEADYIKRQATITRDNRLNLLRSTYEPKVSELKLRISQNSETIKNLQADREKLISDAKKSAKVD